MEHQILLDKLKGQFKGLYEKLSKTELKGKKVEEIIDDFKINLVSNDVALDVAEKISYNVLDYLNNQKVSRASNKQKIIKEAFYHVLTETFANIESIDLNKLIKNEIKQGEPFILLFLGVNGTGKTTTIAKLAHQLQNKGFTIVFGCSDTFRAGSMEQLEEHALRLSIKVIKHQYGSDPAAVAFDTVNYARAKDINVVMIDTAGRMQTDKNLMDEVKKIARVIKPHLKILIVDSLTANDAVQQCRVFNENIGVDGVILTKIDADAKGGAALSIITEIGKPIISIGTGQGYDDLQPFTSDGFINSMLF